MSQDPDRLGEVFRAHQQDVRRLCRRMLGDEAGAEDAAGETFLRAQQRLDSYDSSRPMRSWLLGIAAHHCIDLLRRCSRERRLFEDLGGDPDELAHGGPSPLQQLVSGEQRAAILAAIDALPARYRLPLVLRLFADLDYETIAELLDTSRGQVGTLLFRAKRRLRADLEDEPEGEPG